MLEVDNVSKHYGHGREGDDKQILHNVSLHLSRGEVVGLMGESGCGKTTMAKVIARLINPSSGKVVMDGIDVTSLKGRKLKRYWQDIQIVFQNPESALDPMRKLSWSLDEAYNAAGMAEKDRKTHLQALGSAIALPLNVIDRFPGEVSGGEVQRVALARALIMNPKYLLLDEPTSMLDISVQAQIVRSLMDIGSREKIGMLIISHDADLLKAICNRVLMMKHGRIVRQLPASELPEPIR